MQPTPSPRSTSEAPGVLLHHAVRFLRHRQPTTRRRERSPAYSSHVCQIEIIAAARQPWDHPRTRISCPPASNFSTFAATGLAFFLHARDGRLHAGGVPKFERPHLPVEAQLHGAIDLNDGVGNFAECGSPSKSTDPTSADHKKCARFVAFLRTALEPQQHAQRARRYLRHSSPCRAQGISASAAADIPASSSRARGARLLCFRFCLLVKAAFGLVAQPLALQHLLIKVRQASGRCARRSSFRLLRMLRTTCPRMSRPTRSMVRKRRRLRPAHRLAGQRIDLFDGQVHLLHQAHHVQHGERADAVGDEIRRVLGETTPFPRCTSQNARPPPSAPRSASGVGIISSSRM